MLPGDTLPQSCPGLDAHPPSAIAFGNTAAAAVLLSGDGREGRAMRKRTAAGAALVAVVAALAFAGPASAAVSLRDDGTGFVGRGDVKAALGWDDPQLRANADGLGFVVATESTTRTSWRCTNSETGEVLARRMTLTVNQSRGVERTVRTNWRGAVTGFRLTGFGGHAISAATPDGPAPRSCPPGPWSTVPGSTRTAERTGEPQLRVVHAGAEHELPRR